MNKLILGLALSFMLLVSCSKSDNANSIGLAGTWIFTERVSNSFAYPSVLINPYPIASSRWVTSLDSIKITFDNNGNYEFSNFNLPVDKGRYIVKDSFLIINPDTSGFVKFNYSLISVAFSPVTTPVQYSPYQDFHFSSDTILIKKTTSHNVSFSTQWLTKATSPILPGNDTLILNHSVNNFKRQ